VSGSELDTLAPKYYIAMAVSLKRPRCDDSADESTASVAVVDPMSTLQASSSQRTLVVNGDAVSLSFVYISIWKPPATLYLLANGQVSFQRSSDVPPSCSHGAWSLSPDLQTLRVWFQLAGNWGRIPYHRFCRIPHTDSYELEVKHAEYRAFLHKRTDA
jgi:hypothetical protein